jgi:hypothetical protein
MREIGYALRRLRGSPTFTIALGALSELNSQPVPALRTPPACLQKEFYPFASASNG